MQWLETTVAQPGPAGNMVRLAVADPKRVLLAFASNPSATDTYTTDRGATFSQGIPAGTTNPLVVLDIRTWGELVQQEWQCRAGGFAPTNITVWQLVADTAAQVELYTFRLRDAPNIPPALAIGVRWPQAPQAPRQPAIQRLYDRIRGELWKRTSKRN